MVAALNDIMLNALYHLYFINKLKIDFLIQLE